MTRINHFANEEEAFNAGYEFAFLVMGAMHRSEAPPDPPEGFAPMLGGKRAQ